MTSPGNSTRERVVQLAASTPPAELARLLGISRQAVHWHLRALRIPRAAPAPRSCSVCGGAHCAKDLCKRHYSRMRYCGDPASTEDRRRAVEHVLCDDCGRDCTRPGATRGGRKKGAAGRPGRYRGKDGRLRCDACAWHNDPDFRARKRARDAAGRKRP